MPEIRFFILDADYRVNDGLKILVTGRKDGKKIHLCDETFKPYFYAIPSGELGTLVETISKVEVNGQKVLKVEVVTLRIDKQEKEVLKVFVPDPRAVPDLRHEVKHTEGISETREDDIPFIRRYFIDHQLRPFGEVIAQVEGDKILSLKAGPSDMKPRILAFDIETYAEEGFSQAENNPVIMISLSGCGTSKVISYQGPAPSFAEVLPDEKAMLERFMHLLRELDPDILVGYNSDNFDLPYLRDRCKVLKLDLKLGDGHLSFVKRGTDSAPRTRDMVIMDVYTFIKNIASRTMKAESLDLDTVANELLGTGKEDMTWEELIAAWQSGDLEHLYQYSKKDADLTLGLSEQLFPLLFELSRLINVSVFDVSRMTTGQIVEWFLLSRASAQRLLSPNRPKRDEQSDRMGQTFTGAFVREPQKGLHDNIAVCDFRSLYPSIIIAHNVGPDTLNCECCETDNTAPSGDWFCKDRQAFLPSVLKDVLTLRFELKDQLKKLDKKSHDYLVVKSRTDALKLVANSFYGYLGFFGARWYCLECARAVTSWGREYIQNTMKMAEAEGFVVLYGDTDSLFLSGQKAEFKDDVLSFLKRVNSKLPEMMELELEGIYKRGIFLTKKRYAMVDMQGAIVVKGLERVRRDWAPIARETQEKVLLALLDAGDVEKARQIVQDAIKRLRTREAKVEEVEIYTQLTRDPEDYEQTGPHIKAGLRMRKLGKTVRMGTVVRYIITPGIGSISDRARPVEESTNYDPEYYIEHQVVPACQRILDALDITIESKGQESLKKFF